ncbi:hypothetical protein RDI58_024751 [Solanum bulbocastanum]|uniref:RNase H type-1 domain-containing protein n=1 Tax=Solanum bulbocastanum TaxID=147425 RepID=A0AAN8Y5Y0_SOLBU
MASIDSVYFPRFANSFDHISWGSTETGAFSVKSCFTELKKLTNLELRLNSTTNVDFSWIWGMHLPPMLKQFLWLLSHGRLPTSSFLHSINIIQSPLGVLCDLRVEETCAHLFLLCPKLAPLWSELGITQQIDSFGASPLLEIPIWLSSFVKLLVGRFIHRIPASTFFPFCLWAIWLARNKYIFERHPFSVTPSSIANVAGEYWFMDPKPNRSSVHMYVKWNPFANSNIMLNTDSGFDSASGLSTLGGVFRNSIGDWMLGFTGTCPTSKPLETEMRALLLGLTLALQYEMMHLEINIDSLQLVHLLNSPLFHDSPLLIDCRYLLRRMGDPRVSHVYREQNKLADALVAVAITTTWWIITLFCFGTLQHPRQIFCGQTRMESCIVEECRLRSTPVG